MFPILFILLNLTLLGFVFTAHFYAWRGLVEGEGGTRMAGLGGCGWEGKMVVKK
jgi:hypothetical protein